MSTNNSALQDFPSNSVRNQFDKVFSGSYHVPTSPKIHELRTRDEVLHLRLDSKIDKQENRSQVD
jgi:hypothetical protein